MWAVINALSKVGKNKLEVVVVPSYADLTVNNQRVGSSELYLDDGEYTIEANSPGFSSFKNSFSVPDTKGPIVVLLRPESTSAQKWAESNQKAYQEAEGIAAEQASDYSEQLLEKNPIIGKLPVTTSFYRVDYAIDPDSDGYIIEIRADSEVGRRTAIENIRTLGFETSEYKIRFIDFNNPFEKGNGS